MAEQRTSENRTIAEKALQQVLDAVADVIAYDWSDNDEDAAASINRLREALYDYSTVLRVSKL